MSSTATVRAAEPRAIDVERLMRPRSIAIVGAQPEPTSIGGGVLSNLERFGYDGEIHLVSRSKDEIRGRACVKAISDLPRDIDVVVLIVPQPAIRESVEACVERGVGGVVVFTSGFAEASEDGRRQQEELADICERNGIALLGPNCMGFTNYLDSVPLTFEPIDVRPAGDAPRVAIVAQSGATAANIRFAMHARDVSVSTVVATGNEALLSAEDFISFALDDTDNAAIGVYVEQVRDPARFLEVARRARSLGKPIVLLHPGSSEKGRQAAQSHTGALAGDHSVMLTAVRNEAVVAVETLDEMFDVLAILVRFPTPVQGKLGVVTNSGAIRGLAFDFCERVGLELAKLTPEIDAELHEQVPPYVHVDNPFDIGTTGFANPGIFGTSTASLLKDPGVGLVLLSHAGGSPKMQVKKSDYILPVYETATKPVVLNIIGDDYPLDPDFMKAVRDSGIPFFRSPERAIRALKVVADYADTLAATRDRNAGTVAPLALPARGTIAEHYGKKLLSQLGISTPRGDLAVTADDAVKIAQEIGFPVVLKAQAASLAHKSDAGAVVVGIKDAEALREAWARVAANVEKAKPGTQLDGMLIEQMASPGLEMIVGARRDPQWGPVILVGLGGVWIEALKDARLLPADIDREGVLRELQRLKAAPLLGEFRGQPPRDVDAVAEAVVKLGALMRAMPDIVEVDINPLVVGAQGEGVFALDALFVTE